MRHFRLRLGVFTTLADSSRKPNSRLPSADGLRMLARGVFARDGLLEPFGGMDRQGCMHAVSLYTVKLKSIRGNMGKVEQVDQP